MSALQFVVSNSRLNDIGHPRCEHRAPVQTNGGAAAIPLFCLLYLPTPLDSIENREPADRRPAALVSSPEMS